MPRRHYLLSYDVSDDKRRNRIFETLCDYGDHVQFSVFLCELDEMELARLRGLLGEAVNAAADQVLVVDLGPAHHELDLCIDAIGRGFEASPRALIF